MFLKTRDQSPYCGESDCRNVVLLEHGGSLVELKPPPLSSKAFNLSTVWSCVDRWNTRRFEADSSIQMNVVCLIRLQLISLVIITLVPLLILKILFRIHQTFSPFLCLNQTLIIVHSTSQHSTACWSNRNWGGGL